MKSPVLNSSKFLSNPLKSFKLGRSKFRTLTLLSVLLLTLSFLLYFLLRSSSNQNKNHQNQPLNFNIELSSDGSRYQNLNPNLTSTFNTHLSDQTPLVTLTDQSRQAHIGLTPQLNSSDIKPQKQTNPAGKDILIYPNILPDVDLEYEIIPDGFKETLIIKTAEAAQQFTKPGLNFKLDLKGVLPRQNSQGVYQPEFYDSQTNLTLFYFLKPFMDDATGTTSQEITLSISSSPTPSTLSPTSFSVALTASPDWLTDPARQFPIRIDPGVKGNAPILQLTLDEAYGTTANDNSGNSNHFTLTNATWERTADAFDSRTTYIEFDGTGDYLSRASDTDFNFGTGSFTLSGWFKHNSTAATDIILAHTGAVDGIGWKVYMNSSGYICIGIDDDATSFPEKEACTTSNLGSLADSKWHHFAAVKSGTTDITIYLDGHAVTTTSITGTTGTLDNSVTLHIGIDGDASSNAWTGFIDSITIYNYAKTAAQVQADAATPTAPQLAAAFGSQTRDTLTDNLISWWKLDETSGNAADSSGNAITLTNNSSTPYTGAKFGNGAELDGSTDFLDVADNATLSVTGSLTLSAWIIPDDITGTENIIAKWDGANESYRLTKEAANLRMYIDSDSNYQATTGSPLTANSYTHVAGVYNAQNQTVTLFVNGEAKASSTTGTIPSSIGDDAGDLHLGAEDSSTSTANFFDGHIDDSRIYSRNLSPEEISQLYNWGPTPLAYYSLDENTGTTANDHSGNGNTTQTFSGNTAWTFGQYGSALTFDGTDDVVRITESASTDIGGTLESYTVTAWIKTTTNSAGNAAIIAKNDDSGAYPFSLHLNSSEQPTFQISDGTNSPSAGYNNAINDGDWHHVVGIRDIQNDRLTMYVDGFNRGTATDSTTATAANNDDLSIGNSGTSYTANDFTGSIDDIRIYHYVRSTTQIIEDFNAGHPVPDGTIGSAIHYWKLDDGEGGAGGAEDSMNSSDLSNTSSAWTTSGKFNTAFDGTGANHMRHADDDNFDFTGSEDFSYSLWFKSDSDTAPAAAEYLIDKEAASAGYAAWFDTSQNVNFGIDDDATSFPEDTTATAGTDFYNAVWHHLVIVKTGTFKIEIYLDGILRGSNASLTATGDLSNSDTLTFADRDITDNGDEFFGDIDEIMVFRLALTPAQVKVLYNRASSASLGTLSTTSSGAADHSTDRSYCYPGDTRSSCSPTSHWLIDENTGQDLFDRMGRGDNLTLGSASTADTNDPAWTIGKNGRAALDFDGSDNYAARADDADLDVDDSVDITVSAWIYRESFASDDSILHKKSSINTSNRPGYALWIEDGTDDLNFQVAESSANGDTYVTVDSTTAITATGWHHVVGVFDEDSSTGTTVYIDGVDDKQSLTLTNGSAVTDIGTLTNARPFEIGRRDVAPNDYFDGKIFDVRLYKYALTPAEVAWIYNRGAPIGWWKLDDCTDNIIYDSSKNGNDDTNGNTGTWSGAGGANTSAGTCTAVDTATAWYNGANGKRNASLDFDGTDDTVDMNDVAKFDFVDARNFSIATWVYRDSFTTDDTIVAKKNDQLNSSAGYLLWIDDSTDDVRFVVSDGDSTNIHTVDSTSTITATGWNHIIVAYDDSSSTASKIYINGRDDIATNTTTGTFSSIGDLSNAVDFRLGTESDGGEPFVGQLDDIRLYNYALTAQQAKTVYNDGTATFQP